MNKQGPEKIGWTDWTWNPMTGCWGPGGAAEKPNRCPYCYAERMAYRITAMKHPKICSQCGEPFKTRACGPTHAMIANEIKNAFTPAFHPKRLLEPAKVKKPSKIFVCSMADLFGDWVPEEWIEAVLNRTQRADYSHHTYQFLTKNPRRLKDFNPWPSNCWVGTTVTNQADAD